ncbi:cyclodeaminase/cyclohydrolase family protein [Micromonospora sp. NBC_01796]|uniref:cyclodeaminase/cyclohydrolase family protein n=1 Tax=Micromonospora sp. NBC_01796 TaxID=2975987 RepID=UPI002DD887F3|nr:cyclodeaminase/cyclohydrolase family protein [Micromonospora sp. NBC_01796]WSA84671.1 cyclodeaminase/cyclohydrolase family protein [Micromonospora sp. NBC_01796]
MRDETIGDFLDRLADRVPAPGGGATAALHAAQAAALLGMVARYSTGERYAEHRDVIDRIRESADELRGTALRLAADDASAFTAVTDAYRLPKESEAQRTARSQAIASALVGAAQPPARVIAAATTLITLAEELLPVGNPNVSSDVAAAVEAARAAATTARVNVEINLSGVRDDAARAELVAATDRVDELADRADRVTAAVRAGIAG